METFLIYQAEVFPTLREPSQIETVGLSRESTLMRLARLIMDYERRADPLFGHSIIIRQMKALEYNEKIFVKTTSDMEEIKNFIDDSFEIPNEDFRTIKLSEFRKSPYWLAAAI